MQTVYFPLKLLFFYDKYQGSRYDNEINMESNLKL